MSLRTAIAVTLSSLAMASLTLAAGAVTTTATAAPSIGGLSEVHELRSAGTAVVRPKVPTKRLVADRSRSYAFSSMLDGKPIRWNPCAPITWVSNTEMGPAGGLQVLRESVAKLASLTGTTWVYGGEVTAAAASPYLPATAGDYPPVLLGWTDAAGSDLLRGRSPGVLAVARTAWFGTDDRGVRAAATRAAVVAFDRTDKLPLRGSISWSAVAQHELGHVFGLEHVQDTSQLMSATLQPGLSDLQAGDRAGLAKLGRGAGCVTVPGA